MANGFFIMGLQDGIDTKDIEIIAVPIVGPITVCWVGEKGDCMILPAMARTDSPATVHTFLIDHEPALTKKFLSNVWATAVHLCRVEEDESVIRFLPAAWQAKPSKPPQPIVIGKMPTMESRNLFSMLVPDVDGTGSPAASPSPVGSLEVVEMKIGGLEDGEDLPESWEEVV
ncbi:hypothetical protein HDU67_000649 [Dinochytrium kinnereticum]|nr:hypothetical protein HDU67_000649 [Dinochytrium kinnereticum]